MTNSLSFRCRQLEKIAPFKRKLFEDDISNLRYPITDDYVPINVVFTLIIIIPGLVFIINYILSRDRNDISQGVLSLSLALTLNGVLTDAIKLMVGRPRPDFFERCFPDGKITADFHCTGGIKSEMDGRKSFPSGHSSFAFAGFGFLTLYLMGKFQIFHKNGRGNSLPLLISILPTLTALTIAISRTCDYHHHWQDVVCGSLIGFLIAYLCYRQYYPALTEVHCNRSFYSQAMDFYNKRAVQTSKSVGSLAESTQNDETKKFIDESEKDVKWI